MSLVQLLNDEFSARKSINPRYSLRAFAQRLDIDQSLLSKFLKGDRTLSQGTIVKILQALRVDSHLTQKYIRSPKLSVKGAKTRYRKLKEKNFEAISKWAAFAILEFLQLPTKKWSASRVATALQLSLEETKETLDALVAAGAVEKIPSGYRCKANYNSWLNSQATSESRKRLQKDFLQKAIKAVDEIPLEKRRNLSVTFGIRTANLPKVRKLVENFGKSIVELAETDLPHDEVYQLSVALFPLTHLGENK